MGLDHIASFGKSATKVCDLHWKQQKKTERKER